MFHRPRRKTESLAVAFAISLSCVGAIIPPAARAQSTSDHSHSSPELTSESQTPESQGFSQWWEGTAGQDDGANRDSYNRAAGLSWQNFMGDWRDLRGAAQGPQAYASVEISDTDSVQQVRFDVTEMVRQWRTRSHPNQGMFLRVTAGSGRIVFASREAARVEHRPLLELSSVSSSTASSGTANSVSKVRLDPVADTYLASSTYRCQGQNPELRVSIEPEHLLLKFDSRQIDSVADVAKAELVLTTTKQYGAAAIGVFRCRQGHDEPDAPSPQGLASKYRRDSGIGDDADVIFATGFESPDWTSRWTVASPQNRIDTSDPESRFQGFESLSGRALRSRIAKGEHTALNTLYKFRDEVGSEPEEIYFRYYLRLADDWNQTIQGGKLPGISGTYGRGGWGGRKSDGVNGWSARGLFRKTIPEGNPLGGRTPIGFYCYHADMEDRYGTNWIWDKNYHGYLEKNRWYSIEQYCRLNTPGEKDGVLKAWVDGKEAFEKSDVRFRLTGELRIEQIWMNLYHGGTVPSPYDQHVFIDNVVIAKRYIGPMGE